MWACPTIWMEASLRLALRHLVPHHAQELVRGGAETLAQKALSLDPASTLGYRLLAEVDVAHGRFRLALAQIDRALTLNPGDADALGERGAILVLAGRAEEALPWIERALRIDPGSASRPAFYLGEAYYFLDRYSDAVEALDQAVSGNLGYNTQYAGRSVLAAAYAQLDKPQDAERERAIAMRMAPFLDAERFASQFGTQQARNKMLEGLKKAGFH